MENENWKDVEGFPGYQVSDLGRVRSLERKYSRKIYGKTIQQRIPGRVLSATDNGHGYLSVQLGRRKRVYVHRLVAKHFLPNPNKYKEVNHKNADKKDNRKSNLEWCTRKGNIDHSVKNGLHPSGTEHVNSLLDPEKTKEIRSMLKRGMSISQVASQFHVSNGCISDIKYNRTWRHVT